MRFRSADHAVAAYARMVDRASGLSAPPGITGHHWASRCQRLTCPSSIWRAAWSKRRQIYEARCTRCGSLWPGERVRIPKSETLNKGNPRDKQMAELGTLGLIISRLPTWERRVLVAFVLYQDAGRRSEGVAEDFNERWPWELHAKEIHHACLMAEQIRTGHNERRKRERQRAWTSYRIRSLLAAARMRLESSLHVADLLIESEIEPSGSMRSTLCGE